MTATLLLGDYKVFEYACSEGIYGADYAYSVPLEDEPACPQRIKRERGRATPLHWLGEASRPKLLAVNIEDAALAFELSFGSFGSLPSCDIHDPLLYAEDALRCSRVVDVRFPLFGFLFGFLHCTLPLMSRVAELRPWFIGGTHGKAG